MNKRTKLCVLSTVHSPFDDCIFYKECKTLLKGRWGMLRVRARWEIPGERTRKLVLENYTWQKNAEKTIKVYAKVLSGS